MKIRLFVQIAIALAVGALPLQNAVAQPGSIQSGFNNLHQNYGTTCQQSGGYAPGCGNAPAAAPASPAAPTSLSDALTPAVQSIGNAIGQQIGKAIFGDPAAAAAAQQRQLAAQQNALAAQQSALAAQQLNNSGLYLLRQKTYAGVIGAINEFQQALAITPNDANILHNLAMAKQQLKDVAVAAKTSGALGQFLGNAPPVPTGIFGDQLTQSSVANPNASALSLVNLDSSVVDFRGPPGNTAAPATVPNSDPNVVNLSGTTTTSPASLKSQIDAVFGNPAPVSAPSDAQVIQPQVQAIDQIFLPQQPTAAQSPIDAEHQTKSQVDAIVKKPEGFDDDFTDLRDAPRDLNPRSDPNAAPSPSSNTAVNGTQGTAGTSTGIFGSHNPANPPLETSTPAQSVAVKSTMDQLTSAANSGGTAKAGGISNEAMATEAGCGISNAFCANPQAIPINKAIAQSPGAAALAKHIPTDQLNNPVIQQEWAAYQKLDTLKADAQIRLDAVQQEIDEQQKVNNGKRDPGLKQQLDMQKMLLTSDVNRLNADQADKQAQIKKTLADRHDVKVQWIEDPQPTTTNTPATTSGPATQ